VLSEGLTEETVYLLAEWLSSAPVHGSIAFPEIVVPITILLRKSLKNSKTGSSKESGLVKVFLERVEESAKWMEQRRKSVQFAPSKIQSVQDWEGDLKAHLAESPLGKYMKVQRKTREKRRKLVEKVRRAVFKHRGYGWGYLICFVIGSRRRRRDLRGGLISECFIVGLDRILLFLLLRSTSILSRLRVGAVYGISEGIRLAPRSIVFDLLSSCLLLC
jgi:hypothetical protein